MSAQAVRARCKRCSKTYSILEALERTEPKSRAPTPVQSTTFSRWRNRAGQVGGVLGKAEPEGKKRGARGRATSDSGKETQTSRRSDLGPLPASRKSRPPGTHKRCLEEEAAKRGGLGFSTVWDRCGRRFELTAQT